MADDQPDCGCGSTLLTAEVNTGCDHPALKVFASPDRTVNPRNLSTPGIINAPGGGLNFAADNEIKRRSADGRADLSHQVSCA